MTILDENLKTWAQNLNRGCCYTCWQKNYLKNSSNAVTLWKKLEIKF